MIELTERLEGTAARRADDTLTLEYDRRQKSRQRVKLGSGRVAAVRLPSGTALRDGDHLLASDGTLVQVGAALEEVSTVRTEDPILLARACYHLGNRHVALQVGSGWARYQCDHVLDDMVRGLGLGVTQETAPFEPERGAYHGHSHAGSDSRIDSTTGRGSDDASRSSAGEGRPPH